MCPARCPPRKNLYCQHVPAHFLDITDSHAQLIEPYILPHARNRACGQARQAPRREVWRSRRSCSPPRPRPPPYSNSCCPRRTHGEIPDRPAPRPPRPYNEIDIGALTCRSSSEIAPSTDLGPTPAPVSAVHGCRDAREVRSQRVLGRKPRAQRFYGPT